MENVLKNLREKSILHQDQVIQIKHYIEKKYPLSSKKEKATIFANAVHQVVDLSVIKFEEKNRSHIRTEVLKSAIAKKIFDINGYDVFEVCALIPLEDDQEKETFFEKLTEWINENQEIPLSQEDVQQMATQVIDQAVNAMVNALEETMLIEPEIKKMAINDKSAAVPKSPPERVPSNLTARDIEKALSVPIEDLHEVKFSFEVEAEKAIAAELLKVKKSEEEIPKIQPISKPISKPEEPIQVIKSIADIEVEEPDIGHEEYDSFDVAIKENTKKDRGIEILKAKDWELLDIKEFVHEYNEQEKKIIEYDKHKLFEESRKKEISQVKILIIVVAVIVSLALITFLVIGAMLVSSRTALIEAESRIAALEAKDHAQSLNNAVDLVSYVVASSEQEEAINTVTGERSPMLEENLRYKEYDREKIIAYLKEKDSMLIEKDYLNQLTQISKDFDINPLLLLSIIGQEQAFVPKTHKDAQKIINNPFNVYNSWLTYNTDFTSSCIIAAKTIVTSSQDRPEEVDPIEWINRIYAEDETWHKGVTYFLTTLTSLAN